MTGSTHLQPGIHDGVTSEAYHGAGLTSRPPLSAHVASLLITHSPKHAWTRHPDLNPELKRVEEERFDLGTAVHSLFLQGEDIAEWIDAKDWRTNGAQEARAAARAAGRIPLLLKNKPRVEAMLSALVSQLHGLAIDPPLFGDGKPEQTVIWEQDGVLCKARLDWLRDDGRAVDDLKTCGASAHPDVWSRRTFWSIGCDLQAVMNRHAVNAVTGRTPDFRYAVIECSQPYGLSVFDLAPSALELGERKFAYALRKWRECLETGEWPSYPQRVASVELDAWAEMDFLRLTYDEEVAAA